MFHVTDLLVVAQIKKKLEFLKNNPDQLEYILRAYTVICEIGALVGSEKYVKQCVDVICQKTKPVQKLEVYPYYNMVSPSNHSLEVISMSSETIQFIGDYGSIESVDVPPKVYARTDAIKYSTDNPNGPSNQLVFNDADELSKRIFVGLKAVNRNCSFKILDVFTENNLVTVTVDGTLPMNGNKPILKSWNFVSSNDFKNLIINTSVDDVTCQLQLRTSGDIELHKLFQLVIRYCIKSSRLEFEQNGYQVSKMENSGMPMPEGGDADVVFASQFTISGKSTDSWIESINIPPDRIQLVVFAEEPDEQCVLVEDPC